MSAKITLDQWHALLAVVDEGGYASAAEALDKSQSAISYACLLYTSPSPRD